MLNEDGVVEEGVPDTHGQGAFSLAPIDETWGPDKVLSALYASGVRSLLVHGGTGLAKPFLDASLVDDIQLSFTSRSSVDPGSTAAPGWPLLPPEFRIHSLRKLNEEVVVIEAHLGGHRHEPGE